jgi:hypothetical protein
MTPVGKLRFRSQCSKRHCSGTHPGGGTTRAQEVVSTSVSGALLWPDCGEKDTVLGKSCAFPILTPHDGYLKASYQGFCKKINAMKTLKAARLSSLNLP